MKRFGTRLCLVAAVGVLAVSVPRGARASASGTGAVAASKGKSKGKKRRKAKPVVEAPAQLPADRLDALRAALAGDDDARALDAARALGSSGASNAGDPLIETLATGTTPVRTEAALDAMAKLGEAKQLEPVGRQAFEVLRLYSGHRVPDLRRRAVVALGKFGDPRADGLIVPVLMDRLGDASPDVRGAAGEALAARHEGKAAGRLFALIKRGDSVAAEPLAALATPDLVPQIAELAGTVDDGVLATALGEYVKRDDVPDKLRVDVLRTIGGLPGASATTALVEYVASIPAKDDRPSKREAQKLLDQRGSKP